MKKATTGRINIVKLATIIVAGLILSRLFYLQVWQHGFYKNKSENQIDKIITIDAKRGRIYDRNKVPLSITTPAKSVFANPREIKDPLMTAKYLSPILNIDQGRLLNKLQSRGSFIWLSRKASIEVAKKIEALKLEGIHFIDEKNRVFPHETLAADIIGFVGIDNQGLGGIEYKMQSLLKGKSGKLLFQGDPRRRRLISGQTQIISPSVDGKHVVTTIDHYIQYVTERALEKGVKARSAKAGQVIVMNPNNGDILAMADYPRYNPNNWQVSPSRVRKNSAISDIVEPGSIFKLITISAVLEEGIVTPGTVMKVPETFLLYNKRISEAHKREEDEPDEYTASEIIQKSFNVGTSILAMELGKEKFHRYIELFGFGKKTGIELPGESAGLMRHHRNWNGLDNAMMSFGQAIGVTPIQMVTAISKIANGGLDIRPRVLQYTIDEDGTYRQGSPIRKKGRMFRERTMRQVQEIMHQTVEVGTGQIVKIPGYDIAGKTGTAQKARADGRGYAEGEYISSFVGFFPAYNAEVVILVLIDTPQKYYYGSQVAGPVFKEISEAIIDYYNIAPEMLPVQ